MERTLIIGLGWHNHYQQTRDQMAPLLRMGLERRRKLL